MISVKSSDDDTIAFWNGIENRWEMIDAEKLNEIYGSYDSDYGIQIKGGKIIELGD